MSNLPNWRYRLFDSNTAEPLAGAKLYFYEENTTTPLAVYSDAARTVPHAHPVVADADGYFPTIYLTPEVGYRVKATASSAARPKPPRPSWNAPPEAERGAYASGGGS